MAIYIFNMSPTEAEAVPGMSPYEAWYKRKAKLDFFKLFGYIAYTHLPTKNREKKFDEKAKKRYFYWL